MGQQPSMGYNGRIAGYLAFNELPGFQAAVIYLYHGFPSGGSHLCRAVPPGFIAIPVSFKQLLCCLPFPVSVVNLHQPRQRDDRNRILSCCCLSRGIGPDLRACINGGQLFILHGLCEAGGLGTSGFI